MEEEQGISIKSVPYTISRLLNSNREDVFGLIKTGQEEKVISTIFDKLTHGPYIHPQIIADFLLGLGETGIIALIGALDDERPRLRAKASTILGLIGVKAKSANPKLLKALSSKDYQVREKSAIALGKIRHDPQTAVPALVNLLIEKHSSGAYRGLIGYCPDTKIAVPIFIQLIKHEDRWLRGVAIEILCKINDNSQQVINAISEILNEQEQGLSEYIPFLLDQGPPWDSAVNGAVRNGRLLYYTVINSFPHHNWQGRNTYNALSRRIMIQRSVLVKAYEKATTSIPDLIFMLENENIYVSIESALALAAIGEPAVSVMVREFNSGTYQIKRYLAGVLGYMGEHAASARSILQEVGYAAESIFSREVANAITNIDKALAKAVANETSQKHYQMMLKAREKFQDLPMSKRQELVIRKRLGLEDGRRHTLSEIADEFQYSTTSIRQIERAGLQRLQSSHDIAVPSYWWRISSEDKIWVTKTRFGSISEAANSAIAYARLNLVYNDSIIIEIITRGKNILFRSERLSFISSERKELQRRVMQKIDELGRLEVRINPRTEPEPPLLTKREELRQIKKYANTIPIIKLGHQNGYAAQKMIEKHYEG